MCKQRQQLLDRLMHGFVLAATAGMVAWAILSWACVQISADACESCCEE